MRLSDYLCRNSIVFDFTASDKSQALDELAQAAASTGLDRNAVLAVLLDREKLGSTAVGGGIAIPHGKMPGLDTITLIFARSMQGVDFSAPDNKPCHLFFMVLAPVGAVGPHLKLLGTIARLAKDSVFVNRLLQAKSVRELTDFLSGI